jgi:AbrB family looped-hinge helix DNA binding protein
VSCERTFLKSDKRFLKSKRKSPVWPEELGRDWQPLYLKSKAWYPLLMKSVISSKGQITVPVQIRSKLGLRPGSVVTFEMTKKGALLRKGTSGEHPVDQLYGILASKRRTDDLLDELRGPRLVKRRAKRR